MLMHCVFDKILKFHNTILKIEQTQLYMHNSIAGIIWCDKTSYDNHWCYIKIIKSFFWDWYFLLCRAYLLSESKVLWFLIASFISLHFFNTLFTEASSAWLIHESIKSLEIEAPMVFNLFFFVVFFLIYCFYFIFNVNIQ